jgi:uncharacterized integral membrane protein
MYAVLIAFIFILFFAVAFSLQNADPIVIHFFSWKFEGSLVVVLLSALACGVILTVLASIPSQIKKSRLISRQQKTIAELERKIGIYSPQPHEESKEVVLHHSDL